MYVFKDYGHRQWRSVTWEIFAYLIDESSIHWTHLFFNKKMSSNVMLIPLNVCQILTLSIKTIWMALAEILFSRKGKAICSILLFSNTSPLPEKRWKSYTTLQSLQKLNISRSAPWASWFRLLWHANDAYNNT